MKTGESRRDSALAKKVCCWLGVTVLMEEKARPRRPSDSSWANSEEMVSASSTAWPVTVVPPTSTVSL